VFVVYHYEVGLQYKKNNFLYIGANWLKRKVLAPLCYSIRRAVAGSIPIARRAGIQQAAQATSAISPMLMA
jgi:hypothetical protein